MNTRGLLDQLLKSGQEMLQNKSGGKPGASGGGQLGSLLSGAGGGALAAGAIGLLLGNKKARKFGGKAITYGGLAALGVIAYKAYNNWQQQQNGAAPQAQPQTVDRLPEAQAEVHSHAILQAIVGAAKADGHIDERERQMIEGEVAKLTSDREVQGWLERELNKPLDPAEIARAASTPEIAAEMYLASLLMVDEESFMERSYLEELARQLRLEPSFKLELENQARQALQRLAWRRRSVVPRITAAIMAAALSKGRAEPLARAGTAPAGSPRPPAGAPSGAAPAGCSSSTRAGCFPRAAPVPATDRGYP